VSQRRKPSSTNRKAARRLLLGAAHASSVAWTIPTRWLNTAYGFFLLPIAWVLTQTLFTSFSRVTVQHAFWATEEFWFFSLGALLWMLAFVGTIWVFGEPRPLRLYVFGHELTHAIWVWAMGGRISRFEVARDGGHIMTDTHNFWIALSPYFYPLYSLAAIALYGVCSVFYDLSSFTAVLFGIIGATWAFHISFTLWMIPKGQSDLTYHGTFFSLVVIYLMNLLVLTALLIFAAPEVTFVAFGRDLMVNMEELSAALWHLCVSPGLLPTPT
jgi:hypothetical protein